MVESRVCSYLGSVVMVAGVLTCASVGQCQEIRVLLIRPADARVVPPDVDQVFQQAIREAAPSIGFVTRVAEATDIIEFTSYDDDLLSEGKEGVTSTWRYSFRPLIYPKDPPAGRANPGNFLLVVRGDTRAESVSKSAERLRVAMRSLLDRFRPLVFE